MKIPFKVIGLPVLSLSLLVSGCGDKESGGSGGGSEASSKPLVTKDAKLAIALNLDKDQAFTIVDSYLKMVSDMHVLGEDGLKDAKEMVEACKKDIFACCDSNPKVLEFVEKSGLRDAKLKWAVVSMEDFKVVEGEPRPEGVSVAIGGKFDLEKAIAACEGEKDCDVSFEKTEVEGEKAWRIAPKGDRQSKKLKEAGVDPYVASLGGRLALVAMSQDTLAKQIRLYKKGAEKGDALGGFTAAKGEFLRLYLSGIGELVKQNVPQGELSQLGGFVPNGDKIVTGLQTLTIDTKVDSNGMLSGTIRLKAASEEDADALRTLAKTGLMAATAKVSSDPETPEETKKMIKDIKIGGSDGVVEIQTGASSSK